MSTMEALNGRLFRGQESRDQAVQTMLRLVDQTPGPDDTTEETTT